jgi:hypothetical protein
VRKPSLQIDVVSRWVALGVQTLVGLICMYLRIASEQTLKPR